MIIRTVEELRGQRRERPVQAQPDRVRPGRLYRSDGMSLAARAERGSVRCRSSEVLTAGGVRGVPSLKRMPRRTDDRPLVGGDGRGARKRAAARSRASSSGHRPHMCRKTMRPTKVRASVGSSALLDPRRARRRACRRPARARAWSWHLRRSRRRARSASATAAPRIRAPRERVLVMQSPRWCIGGGRRDGRARRPRARCAPGLARQCNRSDQRSRGPRRGAVVAETVFALIYSGIGI